MENKILVDKIFVENGIKLSEEELIKVVDFAESHTEDMSEIRVFTSFNDYIEWQYDSKELTWGLVEVMRDLVSKENKISNVKEFLMEDSAMEVKEDVYIYVFE